jgi:hypothetical protein
MARPFDSWTVLPHGELIQVDSNLLTVQGELPMPIGDFPRRMTVARLKDGRLVIFSAIALDEPEMKKIEDFGRPAFLIVPSDIHRMDARIWKERYPDLVVVAPEGARERVEEVVPVNATSAELRDSRVRYMTVPGTDEGESALIVQTATGTTLVLNDLIWNVHDRTGLGGWLYRALHLTGPEPQIVNVIRMRKIKDRRAVSGQLESWSRLRGLNRIIVSHGDIVEGDTRTLLRNLALSLAA